MSPTPDDSDDRTLIRPLVAAGTATGGHTAAPDAVAAANAAPAAIAPEDAPTQAWRPDDDDATLILPAAALPPASATAAAAAAPVQEDDGTLPVGTQLAEFELTGLLGIGGFGIVYLAHDRSLGRRVALKEYMPSALAMRRGGTTVSVKSERHRETFEAGLKSFVNEARLLAQFDHPSLVKVYRFWEANGTAYMVMPFYEGITLKDRLRQLGGPPDEAWLRGLLSPLTEALAVIHAEQCFHRDIAPDNIILLAGSGQPLLLDFGAARRVIGDMTQALTVILKPGYAPLEQYAEVPNMKQGPWTDVYALAAVVYYAITGRTPPVSVGRLMHDNYTPLAQSAAGHYSPAFLAAVDHGLMVKPDERTASVATFRAEMGLGGPAPASAAPTAPPPAPTPAPPPAAPTRATAAAAAAAAAATTGGAPARSRTPLVVAGALAALAVLGVAAYLALAPAAAPPTQAAYPAATAPVAAPATAALTAAASAADTASAGSSHPPVAAPAASASPGPFTVAGEFDRVLQGQTAGFNVNVSTPKSSLRIGSDRLKFSVTSSRDGYVYVLVLGPDGSLVRVVPNSAAKANRITAGQPLTLPPANAPLETAEPTGREDFLVVVSTHPRQFDSLGGREQDTFLTLPTGPALARLAAQPVPRQASVLTGVPAGCTAADCWDYGAARFEVEVIR